MNALKVIDFSSDLVHENYSLEQKIEQSQEILSQLEPVEISVESNNINGMYTRKIMIPAGVALVGRVHLYDYVDIMLSGDITVVTPEGDVRYTGYNVLHGKAGRKRFGMAHEDTHWITVHNTPIVDGDEFYETLTAPTIEKYQEMLMNESRKDYMNLIAEMGLSENEVQVMVNDFSNISDFIEPVVYVSCSVLNGDGLFSRKEFFAGERICTSLKDEKRTIAGRYSNHSINPNAAMRMCDDGDIEVIALRHIVGEEEITTNYRDTINIIRGSQCQQ